MTFKELLRKYNPITGKNKLNEILDLTEQNFGVFSRDMELDIRSLIRNSEVVEYFDRIIHEEHPKLEYDKEQKKQNNIKAKKSSQKVNKGKEPSIKKSAPKLSGTPKSEKKIQKIERQKRRETQKKREIESRNRQSKLQRRLELESLPSAIRIFDASYKKLSQNKRHKSKKTQGTAVTPVSYTYTSNSVYAVPIATGGLNKRY